MHLHLRLLLSLPISRLLYLFSACGCDCGASDALMHWQRTSICENSFGVNVVNVSNWGKVRLEGLLALTAEEENGFLQAIGMVFSRCLEPDAIEGGCPWKRKSVDLTHRGEGVAHGINWRRYTWLPCAIKWNPIRSCRSAFTVNERVAKGRKNECAKVATQRFTLFISFVWRPRTNGHNIQTTW